MDLIDRYLNAVAAQLPQDERTDIIAELRDLILSRFEAREEELGRTLTEDEQEAILREIGHPLVVAARYRKGPDSLVGPELFPYWLFGVKAGLMVLAAVFALTLFIRMISGSDNFGQDIAQAFQMPTPRAERLKIDEGSTLYQDVPADAMLRVEDDNGLHVG
jgi:hypothetical protein